MKYILLLLISFNCLAQKSAQLPTTFSVENSIITWEKVYTLEENQSVNDLSNNLKLKMNADGYGTVYDNQCKCRATSSYLDWNFNYDYKVEQKENRYKVTISNIIFIDGITMSLYGVTTTPQSTPFEYYILKKTGELKPGFQTKANLECLDNYFTKQFTIQKTTKKDW